MKKSLASVEVAAIVNELQFLAKGKISQIYHFGDEFLFQLHVPNQGKQLLKIIPGKFIFLTEKKETAFKPSNFCLQLRKYLSNSFIRSIRQKDSERILVAELEKKEKYFLIIELFAPGNVVLMDSKGLVIAALHQQKFKDRFIRPKEKYVFPNPSFDWKNLTETQLKKILKKSDKKNLATSLATEIGFGGLYAEEICKIAEIDKDLKLNGVGEKQIKSLVSAVKKLIDKLNSPVGFIYPEQITPFALAGEKEVKRKETYSAALDTLVISKIVSPYEQKIRALERMIDEQRKAIGKQEKEIELNNQKAELIYQKYQPLLKLLEIVKELKKNKNWSEIEDELKKEKKIKKINLKEKKVVVDL